MPLMLHFLQVRKGMHPRKGSRESITKREYSQLYSLSLCFGYIYSLFEEFLNSFLFIICGSRRKDMNIAHSEVSTAGTDSNHLMRGVAVDSVVVGDNDFFRSGNNNVRSLNAKSAIRRTEGAGVLDRRLCGDDRPNCICRAIANLRNSSTNVPSRAGCDSSHDRGKSISGGLHHSGTYRGLCSSSERKLDSAVAAKLIHNHIVVHIFIGNFSGLSNGNLRYTAPVVFINMISDIDSMANNVIHIKLHHADERKIDMTLGVRRIVEVIAIIFGDGDTPAVDGSVS